MTMGEGKLDPRRFRQMVEDVELLTSCLRASVQELLNGIEALETLVAEDTLRGMSPDEEARYVEHLVESFEKQLIRDLDARLEEHPPRQRDSALNLSFHWWLRAEIFREVWETTRRTRIAKSALSAEARARLRARLFGMHSVFLVRPDSLRRSN
jgi:hypothetical protein